MSDEPKKDEQVPEVQTEASGESLSEKELSAEDLNNVTGGNLSGAPAEDKVVHGDFQVTKLVDAASPKLY